MLDFFQQ